MPRNTDLRCIHRHCQARWSDEHKRWYWPGGGFARTDYVGREGAHKHSTLGRSLSIDEAIAQIRNKWLIPLNSVDELREILEKL